MTYSRLFLIWLGLCSGLLNAQTKETKLYFEVLFGGEKLELGQNYFVEEILDSVKFETVQFYISDLRVQSNSTWKEVSNSKYRLVDLENPSSLIFEITDSIPIEKLKFGLGVDSVTNVSGAFGGDLDPTNGMYWSWQSGYINVKIEGRSEVLQTRKNVFQYHLGGYSPPFNCYQSIVLHSNNENEKVVQLDLKHFFTKLNAENITAVMSPCEEAVRLSALLANLFQIKK